MNIKLFFEAIIKYLLGVILVGLTIFLSANTLNFPNGWLIMCLLFIPMFIAGIIMMLKNPELLKNRLNAKEEEKEQKQLIALSGIMFLTGFILAGLNFRYKWIEMPTIIVIISSIIFLISYILYAEVLRENAYLSRKIEVQKEQKVIDTGLYKTVRHPMYTATIFLFLSIPLILGSLPSFIIFLMYPFIIIKRLNEEEKVLEKDLKGYKEYKNKVKYKLIPFIF